MTTNKTAIAIARGDGIGPEIMDATLEILKAAGARLEYNEIEIGEKLYNQGFSSGISDEAWEIVKQTGILLKAPITTPQGKGHKSLNVTFRKTLGLYANVRPCMSYYPYVDSKHEKMNIVVIRENEEDLYAGVEYRPTSEYTLAYKMISEEGSEKIVRYAFEYAKQNGRKKVTCMIKDNIMKICDGMFHAAFNKVAKEYPGIKADSIIVDIGSARIASRPQDFDVIVTLNLYGDIISDIAAEVSGSVGLAGSANIGDDFAMFEAIHGSAPDISGKGIANPSGLLNGAVMMLEYIGQGDVAAKIKNAWLRTIEDGIHTADIYKEGVSDSRVGTKKFAESVIANLGRVPQHFQAQKANKSERIVSREFKGEILAKKLLGTDIYLSAPDANVDELAAQLSEMHPELKLEAISRKGLKLWPQGDAGRRTCEYISCRFTAKNDNEVTQRHLKDLLGNIDDAGLNYTSMQNIYSYDNSPGFSMPQG